MELMQNHREILTLQFRETHMRSSLISDHDVAVLLHSFLPNNRGSAYNACGGQNA